MDQKLKLKNLMILYIDILQYLQLILILLKWLPHHRVDLERKGKLNQNNERVIKIKKIKK